MGSTTRRFAFFLALLLGAPFLAGTPAAAADRPDAVLAAGEPPLTRGMVDTYVHFLEWVLDSALTAAQARELRTDLVASWRAGDRAVVQQTLDLLELHERVRARPEAERDFLRAQALPALLEELRGRPDDESARWILAVYDASHGAIAPGDPPLTRQASDAYAEAMVFVARQVTGRPFAADEAFKTTVAEGLVAAWPRLAPEARRLLASCPLLWAALRLAWPQASEAERADLVRRWTAAFGPIPEPDAATAETEQALAALEALEQRGVDGTWTPLELRQAANRMEIVAEHLRHLGGDRNQATAADLDRTARAWRAAAARAEAGDGDAAFAEAMALEQRQHAAYVALSNAALTSHVGTMNMLGILGGSPWRYSVR